MEKRINMPVNDKLYNIVIIICLCSGVISRISEIPYLRYLQYIGLIFGIIFCTIYGFKKLRILPSQVICYILLICFGSLSCFNLEFAKISYIVFWLSAVLLILPYNEFNIKLNLINIIFVLAHLVVIKDLNLDLSWIAFLKSSSSSAEAGAPTFVLSLFFLYQLFKGNKWLCIMNLICSLILFKRIAIIAMAFCTLIYLYQKYISKKENLSPSLMHKTQIFFILSNILYIVITILFVNGFFAHVIHSTGVSVGELTMGRNTLYKYVTKDLLNSDIFQFLFGHGTASCITLLNEYGIHDDLHNDILKILYEYGIVIFFLFFFLLYRNVKTWYQLSLSIMVNIFFLSDNTLIYATAIITFFIVNNNNLESENKTTPTLSSYSSK